MRDLDKLYQQLSNGKKCVVCGKPSQCSHHLIGRRNEGLRYDPRNALFVCLGCHNKIHSGEINDWDYVSNEQEDYLKQQQYKSLKQYLVERGITKADWIKEQREMLKELLNETI